MRETITEEMGVHKKWYEEARKVTPPTLPEFVRRLTEDYQHDYGTICHAAAACAVAAASAVDHSGQGGITGFQAGVIFWEFYQHWLEKPGPARLVEYDNMLYPQYAEEFANKTISKDTWKYLQDRAVNLLADPENRSAHSAVQQHWIRIINGTPPFGYVVEVK